MIQGPVQSRWLTRTVLGIGAASLFSDLSHETVTSLLPALFASMGVGAGALGTMEKKSGKEIAGGRIYWPEESELTILRLPDRAK